MAQRGALSERFTPYLARSRGRTRTVRPTLPSCIQPLFPLVGSAVLLCRPPSLEDIP